MSAKKIIFYHYFHTLNTQSMSYSINLYQSVSLSPSSHSVSSSSSHSMLKFPPSSLAYYNISPPVSSTATDVQHFLKPFTVSSDEMLCHAVMIHVDYIIHLYFLVFNYLNPWSFTIFYTDGLNCVKNFKHMCSGLSCCVCGLMSLSSGLFLWFLICGLVRVLFLSSVINI